MDSKIVQVALSGLENILRVGKQDAFQNDGINQFAVMVEEAYGKSCDTTCMRPCQGWGGGCHLLEFALVGPSNGCLGRIQMPLGVLAVHLNRKSAT